MAPHPLRDHPLKLGRSRRSETPEIDVEDFVDIEKAKAYPVAIEKVVDWSGLVRVWPMFLNDRWGDCVPAGWGHRKQVAAAAVNEVITITDPNIERMYEASGWDPNAGPPGENPTDNGWSLEEACEWGRKHSIVGGDTPDIVASVNVHYRNEDATQVAMELFGGTYVGVELPESAEQQFGEGKPWTVVQGSPIAGGHCIYRVRSVLTAACRFVTWGNVVEATPRWRYEYVDEQIAVVPVDWESKLPEPVKELGIVDFAKLDSLLSAVE